jgi:hypothetical protein
LIGVPSSTLNSSIIGRSVDDDRLPLTAARHEAVAQHQVGRNRPEQLLVDPELVHVEKVEPVPLRQAAGPRRLLASLGQRGGRFAGLLDQRLRIERFRIGVVRDVHQRLPITDVSWKSGM